MDLEGIKCPVDAANADSSGNKRSLSELRQASLELGLSAVLSDLQRLLKLLGVLINQNQQMLDLVMQMDPETEPTKYLDGTPRGK